MKGSIQFSRQQGPYCPKLPSSLRIITKGIAWLLEERERSKKREERRLYRSTPRTAKAQHRSLKSQISLVIWINGASYDPWIIHFEEFQENQRNWRNWSKSAVPSSCRRNSHSDCNSSKFWKVLKELYSWILTWYSNH